MTNQKDPIKEMAMISAIDIQVNNSIQDMVTVSVQGSLPTNCSNIGEVTHLRDQGTFIINIEVIKQSDPDCLEVDSFFEEIVNLDVRDLPEGRIPSMSTVKSGASTFKTSPRRKQSML